MSKTLELFLIFLKIGATTHGGGYAMVGIMQKELVERREMIDDDSFMETISVCQSLPGPLAVTSSSFVGYRLNGFAGALACFLGATIPSFIIILLIATILTNFSKETVVKHALSGIEAAVPVIVLIAVKNFWKKLNKTVHNIIYALIAFIALEFFKINPAIVIIFSAIYGIVVYRSIIKERKE